MVDFFWIFLFIFLLKKNSTMYGYIRAIVSENECEPVWPSGKALGWYAEGPRFESASALLSLRKSWSVDTVM